MPKDYFTVKGASAISDIPQGGTIHVIGICGVAMAQLSVSLHELGYKVSGSDKEFYEPMNSLLRSYPIKLFDGYSTQNIDRNTDLVVIGNSVSYGNPELGVVEEFNIKYSFFPKLLNDVLIRDTHGISVSGTHGKSTTSALCASVLRQCDDASYFVGGIVKGFSNSLHVGHGKYSVVEADEYDSAFFAKVPKFYFYRADTLIITSIEFDHADIYNNVEEISRVFTDNVNKLPSSGSAIVCIDYPVIRSLIPEWKSTMSASLITYGESLDADIRLVDRCIKGRLQELNVHDRGRELSFQIPLFGRHNALNAVAVYASCNAAGVKNEDIFTGLKLFQGVLRRQDIRAEKNGILLIEDFAHHPTAVRETLRGIREAFPNERLIAIFEPRSNTSRRKVFENEYILAFDDANQVILSEVSVRDIDKGMDLLDVKELADKINLRGKLGISFSSTDQISRYIKAEKRSGDVIVVMSNGSFGGLINVLRDEILEGR